MDLTSDTVAAANLIAPNTAHGADGEPVVGAASAGGSGSITIEEIPNATGTTLQITTNGSGGGGSTPSATQHTIHLEFSDETDADINVYYDDALIGTMITAYSPSPWTQNNKLVYYASLDNVLWYDGSGSWETVYDRVTSMNEDTESDAYYAWVSALGDVPITENSVWKVTWKGVERTHTAVYTTFGDRQRYGIDSRNDGTNGTYYIYDTGYGAWMFVSNDSNDADNISIKIEQKTS